MITEPDILIAEFVGYRPDTSNRGDEDDFWHAEDESLHCDSEILYIDDFKFGTSWDWLMPVVEKIKLMRICYGDDGYNLIEVIDENLLEVTLPGTYASTLQFIKWYNENKSNE